MGLYISKGKCFSKKGIDYCLVCSGRHDARLEQLAQSYNWSYLYTEENQVCYIQNIVVELHPSAEYVIKLDEDMFIGSHFFSNMLETFHRIEKEGEYRIGFAVPVIPLNCCGYATYLKLAGEKTKTQYEEKFGRAYKSRFSAVFSEPKTAEFLWDTMTNFDSMEEHFSQNVDYDILDCYFNIGCIMFTRSRWLMMGKWPETAGSSGMGEDESYINQDNHEKDMAIYEIHGALVGHLAFGNQKEQMHQYFREHKEKFVIQEKK